MSLAHPGDRAVLKEAREEVAGGQAAAKTGGGVAQAQRRRDALAKERAKAETEGAEASRLRKALGGATALLDKLGAA